MILTKDDSVYCKDDLVDKLIPIKSYIQDDTFDAFNRIIDYYFELENMKPMSRGTSEYNLTSAYALLLLNFTYDLSIKEIYRCILKASFSDQPTTIDYLADVIDTKILNRYMTNIKHDVVKKSLKINLTPEDTQDAVLQQAIRTINDLVDARNNIAHSIEISSKGHNDLKEALESVIYYLTWYCNTLRIKFST